MKIRIELGAEVLKELVQKHLNQMLGDLSPETHDVRIEVKSKQNYKSEWEDAEFRAVYESYK